MSQLQDMMNILKQRQQQQLSDKKEQIDKEEQKKMFETMMEGLKMQFEMLTKWNTLMNNKWSK